MNDSTNASKALSFLQGESRNGNSSVVHQEDDRRQELYAPWFAVYGLICPPVVIGNVLILLSLSKFRDVRGSIHILIANLAIADLVVGALLLPYCIAVDAFELNSRKYFCLAKSSLMVFSVAGTCYGLLMVSVDRFFAVCFPFKYHRLLCPKRVLIALIVGWTYVTSVAFLPMTGWNYYDKNQPFLCHTDYVWTPIYQKFVNAHFVAGLFLNITLYVIVMRIAINKARKIYGAGTAPYDIRRNYRELYKVKTMAMVQGLFALCWFPYSVLAVMMAFIDNETVHNVLHWSIVPGLLNSAFNWLIYGYRNKQLRHHMKMYLRCRFHTAVNPDVQVPTCTHTVQKTNAGRRATQTVCAFTQSEHIG